MMYGAVNHDTISSLKAHAMKDRQSFSKPMQYKKTIPGGVKRPHHFFIKRKPNRLNRVENPPNPGPCP